MITVREKAPGVFEQITGNPTLDSLDGEIRAPLSTVMHPSWSAEERAAFGIYLVEPFKTPAGKRTAGGARFERVDGKVVQAFDVEDAPAIPIVKTDRLGKTMAQRLDEMEARIAALEGKA
jgi:hypothetical protein